jgi:hypothetical protein
LHVGLWYNRQAVNGLFCGVGSVLDTGFSEYSLFDTRNQVQEDVYNYGVHS